MRLSCLVFTRNDQSFTNGKVKINHYNYNVANKRDKVLSALPYTFSAFLEELTWFLWQPLFNKKVFNVSTWGNDIKPLNMSSLGTSICSLFETTQDLRSHHLRAKMSFYEAFSKVILNHQICLELFNT